MASATPLSYHPLFSKSSKMKFDSRNRVFRTRILAARREANNDHQNYYGGAGGSRLVDENMIVLRKRIHEMKMVERNYEPPSDWMEWEKQYFTSYDSLICEMMGFLQTQLMDTRPSLALGIIALVTLSVPMSTAMLLFHLMEISKMVVGQIHLIN